MQKKVLEEIKALKEGRINPECLDKKLYNDKKIIDCLRKEKQLFSVEKGYDIINNNFFVKEEIEDRCIIKPRNFQIKKQFDNFSEYFQYLNGDIYEHACYFQMKFDEKTVKKYNIKLDKINYTSLIDYTINDKILTKEYGDILKYYDDGKFIVYVRVNNKSYADKKYEFSYFFDFLYFLNNDLSNADLLLCDGLINLNDVSSINFACAHIRSEIKDKLKIDYKEMTLPFGKIFKETEKNELSTKYVLEAKTDTHSFEYDKEVNVIAYVSDIHIDYNIMKDCKSYDDIVLTIRRLTKEIFEQTKKILLISGDITFSFELYKIFIFELSKLLKDSYKEIFLVLGNHELWNFTAVNDADKIANEYKKIINKCSSHIHLVHNNLFYNDSEFNEISEADLTSLSVTEIRKKLRKASIIITGGIGFSGYNCNFNATNGIYCQALTREQEIFETKRFEKLYRKLTNCIYDKNTIVLTHMPSSDWLNDNDFVKKWVYVNGHTHKNYYFDDEIHRVYADNQLGYKYSKIRLKYFSIRKDCDIFADYSDGIYTISNEEYNAFLRSKNIMGYCTRASNVYMLKKSGYYCFLKSTSENNLCIMNGGNIKKLKKADVNYYYQNMDTQINLIKKPLDKYTKIQKIISEIIKINGGIGKVHGAIIDIDYFNHVYLNPEDLQITIYYAENVIDKYILNTFSGQKLFYKYKLLKSNNIDAISQFSKQFNYFEKRKIKYCSTTIMYKDSRQLSKMQRLYNNILTTWYDDITNLKIEAKIGEISFEMNTNEERF